MRGLKFGLSSLEVLCYSSMANPWVACGGNNLQGCRTVADVLAKQPQTIDKG
jgi:hypothetical protein